MYLLVVGSRPQQRTCPTRSARPAPRTRVALSRQLVRLPPPSRPAATGPVNSWTPFTALSRLNRSIDAYTPWVTMTDACHAHTWQGLSGTVPACDPD